jgi:hypothetical protein
MTSRSVDIRHRYHGALTTWADRAGSRSCGQRGFVALTAERAHDVNIVDRFCSGGGPADVAVALPSGDQMDVQVRDPLPLAAPLFCRTVSPSGRSRSRSSLATDLTVTISAAAVSSSRSQMLST